MKDIDVANGSLFNNNYAINAYYLAKRTSMG